MPIPDARFYIQSSFDFAEARKPRSRNVTQQPPTRSGALGMFWADCPQITYKHGMQWQGDAGAIFGSVAWNRPQATIEVEFAGRNVCGLLSPNAGHRQQVDESARLGLHPISGPPD